MLVAESLFASLCKLRKGGSTAWEAGARDAAMVAELAARIVGQGTEVGRLRTYGPMAGGQA